MINLEKYSDQAALIGRLLYSLMFLLFGFVKITAYTHSVGHMSSLGLPAPSLVVLLAIIIEVGGGLLMLVGYQTRIVSLGLAIYVLVSALIAHSQLGDTNHFQYFMRDIAIVGGSLAFFAFGGGAYSLDAKPEALKRLRMS
jgi:putative oxidoreductase